MYAGKTYYIPHYNKLVYCHADEAGCIILGGMCYHYHDARTNVIRQKLCKDAIGCYEFKYVDPALLHTYLFLTHDDMGYFVHGDHEMFGNDFITGSLVLSDAPRKLYKQPLPIEN